MKDVTGILGLAARARKTATGEIVYTQLRARHVHLLILAEDIGDNAKKKLNDKCSFYKVPCLHGWSINEYGDRRSQQKSNRNS